MFYPSWDAKLKMDLNNPLNQFISVEAFAMHPLKKTFVKKVIALQIILAAFAIILLFTLIPFVKAQISPAQVANPVLQDPGFLGMVALSVSLSISVSAVGAGLALKGATAAAISALTEREATFSKAIVFVAFGETLAIYGLIVAILLLQYLSKAFV